jgi:hypothetical protein
MFLESEAPLGPGALLTLEIEGSSKTITVDARVLSARTKSIGPDFPAGMSVRFIDLPSDVAATLQTILSSRIKRDPTMLGLGESEGASAGAIPELPKLPRPPTSQSGEIQAVRFGPTPTPSFALEPVPLPKIEPVATPPMVDLTRREPVMAPPPNATSSPPSGPAPPPPAAAVPHFAPVAPPRGMVAPPKKSRAGIIALVVVALALVALGTSGWFLRHRIHETFLGPRH